MELSTPIEGNGEIVSNWGYLFACSNIFKEVEQSFLVVPISMRDANGTSILLTFILDKVVGDGLVFHSRSTALSCREIVQEGIVSDT